MYSDEFYRQLIDNMYDGVYFVDRDRTITYWNQRSEWMTGATMSYCLLWCMLAVSH
jgi:PAS domain S-box-containing protein